MSPSELSLIGNLQCPWLQRYFYGTIWMTWRFLYTDVEATPPPDSFLYLPTILNRLCILIFIFFFPFFFSSFFSERFTFNNYRIILCEFGWVSQLVSAKCPHQFSWSTIISLRFPELGCLHSLKNDLWLPADPCEHMTIFQCHLSRANLPKAYLGQGPPLRIPSDPAEWRSHLGYLLCVGW